MPYYCRFSTALAEKVGQLKWLLLAHLCASLGVNVRKLLNIRQLSEVSGVPVRTWRTLWKKGVVAGLKVGHRTLLFEPDKVLRDLQKYEIRK